MENALKTRFQPSANLPDIDNLPLAMYSCLADKNWTMQYLSDGFSSLFGYCNEDILYNRKISFSQLIHPDDVEVTYNLLPKLAHGHTFTLRFRMKCADGSFIRVEDRGTVVQKDGKQWQVEGVLIPLEEHTLVTNHHVRETSRVDFSNLFEITPNFVCIINEEGNFDAVNSTFIKQLGFSQQEFHSRPVLSFVHEEDRSATMQEIEIARSGGTVFNFRNRIPDKDGNLLTILWTASRGKRGRIIYAVGQDISDIINKKQQLRDSNQRFRLAAAASNEMIWEWIPEQEKVQRTGNYEALLGPGAAEKLNISPEKWFRRIHPDDIDGFKNSLDVALKDPEVKQWEYEYRILNKAEKYAHIFDRGIILRDDNGKALRVTGAALDITQSKEMLNEITKQNAQLRKIAWTQSHKLRAPLARAMGLYSMIQEQDFEPMTRDELLENIGISLTELDDIVREIVNTIYT